MFQVVFLHSLDLLVRMGRTGLFLLILASLSGFSRQDEKVQELKVEVLVSKSLLQAVTSSETFNFRDNNASCLLQISVSSFANVYVLINS